MFLYIHVFNRSFSSYLFTFWTHSLIPFPFSRGDGSHLLFENMLSKSLRETDSFILLFYFWICGYFVSSSCCLFEWIAVVSGPSKCCFFLFVLCALIIYYLCNDMHCYTSHFFFNFSYEVFSWSIGYWITFSTQNLLWWHEDLYYVEVKVWEFLEGISLLPRRWNKQVWS